MVLSKIAAALIRLLARLPMRVLHRIASFLAFLMIYVIRYRRKVIMGNLQNAFPEKSERELASIARSFYRHLADVVVETIKLNTIREDDFLRRCSITEEGTVILQNYYDRGENITGLLGHFGNWEWVPAVVSLNFPYLVAPAYKPLSNKVFDKLVLETRSRYAHELIPKARVSRAVLKYIRGGKPFVLGLIADQAPRPETAYWTQFLSQKTPVYSGPEKLARSLNTPVVFVALRRKKRGHYILHVEKLADRPGDLEEGELSARFMALLEKEIMADPGSWLWSHRRWKYKNRKKQ